MDYDCSRAAVEAAESLQDMASGMVYSPKASQYDGNSVQNSEVGEVGEEVNQWRQDGKGRHGGAGLERSGSGSNKAFLSVHDMIHASILANGARSSLRDIYASCKANGRIVYKRSGGSRLITDNEHWKSQIR